MHCKLCHSNDPLRNSHIIPEFLYKALYDDKHRFFEISSNPDKKTSFQQKGLREKLLCDACEQRLSIWEQYTCKLLHGGVAQTYSQCSDDHFYLEELDYKKLKLFQLSVLWRAGLSSLPMLMR